MFTSKTIDVTVPMRNGMDVFPGDPEYKQEFAISIAAGQPANVSRITTTSHAGTHVDAPLHFIANGKDASQLCLETLIGPCQVIEVKDEQMDGTFIPRSVLPDTFKYPRVLFKTYMSKAPGKFRKDESGLSLEAAKHMTACGVKLIGIDSFSVECVGCDGSVHRELLGKEVILVETMDLSKVTPGYYNMICLPAKIVGCDGAHARTLLTPIE